MSFQTRGTWKILELGGRHDLHLKVMAHGRSRPYSRPLSRLHLPASLSSTTFPYVGPRSYRQARLLLDTGKNNNWDFSFLFFFSPFGKREGSWGKFADKFSEWVVLSYFINRWQLWEKNHYLLSLLAICCFTWVGKLYCYTWNVLSRCKWLVQESLSVVTHIRIPSVLRIPLTTREQIQRSLSPTTVINYSPVRCPLVYTDFCLRCRLVLWSWHIYVGESRVTAHICWHRRQQHTATWTRCLLMQSQWEIAVFSPAVVSFRYCMIFDLIDSHIVVHSNVN